MFNTSPTIPTYMMNPYIAESGIFPPYFAGRTRELNEFQKRLNRLLSNGIAQHIAYIGDWGMGKTSLLLKIKEITENHKCKVLPVSIYNMSSPQNFVSLFLNSASFIIPPKRWKVFKSKISSLDISAFGMGISFNTKDTTFEPQTALQHGLRNIWETVDQDKPIIIVIDDIQNLSESSVILSILRNVFIWAQAEGYKFMLVVTGMIDLFSKFWQAHSPITRFFTPMILGPLTRKEVEDAAIKPLQGSNIKFTSAAIDKIYEVSEGNTFYVQLLCQHAFEHKENMKITTNSFDLGFVTALNEISSRMFDQIYSTSTESEQQILKTLLNSDVPLRFSEIVERAKEPGIPESTVKTSISKLRNDEMIKKNLTGKYKNCYEIRDRFFKEFLRLRITPSAIK